MGFDRHLTSTNSTLGEIATGLEQLAKEQFVYVGTLELITGVIAFLGLLFAFSRRITNEYQTTLNRLLKNCEDILLALKLSIAQKTVILDKIDEHTFNEHKITSIAYHMREYTINHFMYFLLGVLVLVAYGLALLTEQLPYSFFVTFAVIVVSMCPSIVHSIRHHRQAAGFSSSM